MVAPYVPHAKLTTLDLEPEASCHLGATPRVSSTGSASSNGGKEEFGRSPQAAPDPKKRKEYEAKLLAEKEAKLAAKAVAKAERNKRANGGSAGAGASEENSNGASEAVNSTASSGAETTTTATAGAHSDSSSRDGGETSENRRQLSYFHRRRRLNGFDLPEPITHKPRKRHHNHSYSIRDGSSLALPGDETGAATPASGFIGHGEPRAHERDISIYFRGSVMHGVMCKKRGTWPRREAYFAMRRLVVAMLMTEKRAERFVNEDEGGRKGQKLTMLGHEKED